jgi:hypothetical protein
MRRSQQLTSLLCPSGFRIYYAKDWVAGNFIRKHMEAGRRLHRFSEAPGVAKPPEDGQSVN